MSDTNNNNSNLNDISDNNQKIIAQSNSQGIDRKVNTHQRTGRSRKRKSRYKGLKIFIILLIVLFVLAAVIGSVYYYLQYKGMKDLQQTTNSDNSELVLYKGEYYSYNDRLINLLLIGIDKTGEIATGNVGLENGQADTLFLASIDPDQKSGNIVAINRNTMTNYDVYSLDTGEYVGQQRGQIALSYGYGGGGQRSCESTVKAVSQLLRDIPISGYYAVNKEAIIPLNDAVGGVTVTLDDGTELFLQGYGAQEYISTRDVDEFDSATDRLERQQNYVKAYLSAAQAALKNNIKLPLEIYDIIKEYSLTNISSSEMLYLASLFIDSNTGEIAINSLDGTTKMGEIYEEYYVKDAALLDLVIDIFYEKVDPDALSAEQSAQADNLQ